MRRGGASSLATQHDDGTAGEGSGACGTTAASVQPWAWGRAAGNKSWPRGRSRRLRTTKATSSAALGPGGKGICLPIGDGAQCPPDLKPWVRTPAQVEVCASTHAHMHRLADRSGGNHQLGPTRHTATGCDGRPLAPTTPVLRSVFRRNIACYVLCVAYERISSM